MFRSQRSKVRRSMLELTGHGLEVRGQKSWVRSQASLVIGQRYQALCHKALLIGHWYEVLGPGSHIRCHGS